MRKFDSLETETRWVSEIEELFGPGDYHRGPRGVRRIRIRIRMDGDAHPEVLIDSPHSGLVDEMLEKIARQPVEKVPCG